MDKSRKELASKAIGAVALGVLAGTVLGVLFAPNKGSKTRENIAGNAKKISKNLKKKIIGEVKTLKKKVVKLENKAENILKDFKKNIEKKAMNFENKAEDKFSDFSNNSDHQVADLMQDKK